MGRRYTAEEKEYSRLRKNYIQRIRYQAKKQNLSKEEIKDVIYQNAPPTIKQLHIVKRDVKTYNFNFNSPTESLKSYIDKYTLTKKEEYNSNLYYQEQYYEDWREYNADEYEYEEEQEDTQISDLVNRFFTRTDENNYIFNLTGEIFDNKYQAYEHIQEYDIHNAIYEGETILNSLFNYIEDAVDLRNSDYTISLTGIDAVRDILVSNVTKNEDAFKYKLHNLDENITDTVAVAIRYSSDGSQERALTALTELLELSQQEIQIIDDFLNSTSTEGSLYKGSFDDTI